MRRIIPLLAAALSATYVPQAAQAQFARGGYLVAARGSNGGLVDSRIGVDMAYTVEAGGFDGPYVGGRGTLGIHWLRADEDAFHATYGEGEVRGGGGTLYDTGVDVEVGFGVGVVRVYGFTGFHYYQQFQDPATVRADGEDREVLARRRAETIGNARGAGVMLHLADTGGLVAEWYRGGGQDGVMRLSGTRFGLRWAW